MQAGTPHTKRQWNLHRDTRPDNFITKHEGKDIAIILDFAFSSVRCTRQQHEWLAAEYLNRVPVRDVSDDSDY